MVEGDPRLFIVGSTYKNNFDKSLTDLRDKRMIPVDFDKLAKMQITGPKLNLTFSPDAANNGKYIVQDPKNLRVESATLSDIVDKLRLATMDLGAKDADAKKSAALYSAGVPVATIKVTDTTGASQEMQVREEQRRLLCEIERHGRRLKSFERPWRQTSRRAPMISAKNGCWICATILRTRWNSTME